ncbi:MAG: hypothetical protein ABI112_02560 [Terracoccus sp.]
MYAALWRMLPGPTVIRVVTLLVILSLAVLALFTIVFPWATQFVPGQEVSVD